MCDVAIMYLVAVATSVHHGDHVATTAKYAIARAYFIALVTAIYGAFADGGTLNISLMPAIRHNTSARRHGSVKWHLC
jgi:hypothetical protein